MRSQPSGNPRSTDDIQRLQDLFSEGSARYSASDYIGAIEKFTTMLSIIESEGGAEEIRGATLYNLAQSYERAYDMDRDARYLRMARETYRRYVREAEVHGFAYEDLSTVRHRLAEVEAHLERIEREKPDKPKTPPPVVQPEAEPDPTAKPLIASGISATVLGVLAAGLGGTGIGLAQGAMQNFSRVTADQRDDEVAKGEAGNVLIITGFATAGVLVPLGAVLWSIGVSRKHRSTRTQARVQVAPLWSRNYRGANLLLRF